MYTFTVPREKFDERAPDKQMIRQLISKHISIVGRMQKNMAYYKGQHEILSDADRENKLVCNHAKDISGRLHNDCRRKQPNGTAKPHNQNIACRRDRRIPSQCRKRGRPTFAGFKASDNILE